MSKRAHALVRLSLGLAALAAWATPAAADLITQSASLPLTTTDFTPDGKIAGNPLVFQQFDTEGGSRQLDAITLTVHAKIQNDYGMKFTTPATITNTVATGKPESPGPVITVYQPNGKTPLLSAQAPNDASLMTRSVAYGFKAGETSGREFSSSLPASSPYYIAPTVFDQSQTLKLTAPADLALFSGKGKLSLPVGASAYSKFTTSSGNGFGSISTKGSADVTVLYQWHPTLPAPQTVPEPTAMVLWGLGATALGWRVRARTRRTAA